MDTDRRNPYLRPRRIRSAVLTVHSSRRYRGLMTLCGALVIVLISIAAAAQAAYPGRNGAIFFTSSPPIVHGYGSEEEIWTMNPDGSDPHSVTPEPEPDHGASLGAVSPSGRKIAFTSSRTFGSTETMNVTLKAAAQGDHPGFSSVNQIFVMNSDGTGQHQLTFTRAESGCPSFTPNGRQNSLFQKLLHSWHLDHECRWFASAPLEPQAGVWVPVPQRPPACLRGASHLAWP